MRWSIFKVGFFGQLYIIFWEYSSMWIAWNFSIQSLLFRYFRKNKSNSGACLAGHCQAVTKSFHRIYQSLFSGFYNLGLNLPQWNEIHFLFWCSWSFKINKWTDGVLLTTLTPQMNWISVFSIGTKLNSKSFSYLCYKSVLVIRELNVLDILLLAVSDMNLIASVLWNSSFPKDWCC